MTALVPVLFVCFRSFQPCPGEPFVEHELRSKLMAPYPECCSSNTGY